MSDFARPAGARGRIGLARSHEGTKWKTQRQYVGSSILGGFVASCEPIFSGSARQALQQRMFLIFVTSAPNPQISCLCWMPAERRVWPFGEAEAGPADDAICLFRLSKSCSGHCRAGCR